MSYSKFSILLCGVLFFLNTHSIAQKSIEGRILDLQTQEPLAGVSIAVPGTTIGTASDADGRFTLQTEQDISILRITFVGYIPQEVSVNENSEFLNIRMEPDNIALNEVQVIGMDTNKKLQETAAPVALRTLKDFERTSKVSFMPVLNSIPGVRMDQNNLSDARISIRGGGIRSNFGTRNVKIYVNEIPITEADGFTRIEGLDVATIGRVEVIKGPASSIYGAGTGGVINFQIQRAPYRENSLEASGLAGSHGLNRGALTYRLGSDKFNTAITVGNQTFDGFREHNNDERNFFTGSLQLYPSEKQTITMLLNRTSQETQLPGNLTAAQVDENPRQANAFNVVQQAARNQTWTRIGISQRYAFSGRVENVSSVYTSFYELDHPLNFAYLRQPYQAYGGRTRMIISPKMNRLQTRFIVGGEFINAFVAAKRFVNNQGEEGDLIFNQELDNTQFSLFYQSETQLTDQTSFTFGISLNKVNYDVRDFINEESTGEKDFDTEVTPRFALSHVFNDQIGVYGNVSWGFSPPTTSEIRGADGSIRDEVQAEKGINYEIGARGMLFNRKLNYSISGFSFQLEDQLIPQTVGQNNTIFNNAGETSQLGLETSLSYNYTNKGGFLIAARPFLSYTYSDFQFDEFRRLDAANQVVADFSGNDLTGISPHMLSLGLDLQTAPGFYLNTTYFFHDEAPINDANTLFNPSYHLLNSKLGYKRTLGSLFEIELYAGIDNIFDETYTSRVALNATGFGGNDPAFFDPALDRNFYSGISVKYSIKQ